MPSKTKFSPRGCHRLAALTVAVQRALGAIVVVEQLRENSLDGLVQLTQKWTYKNRQETPAEAKK